jgi:GNAT superfamily N-acetyltransferase
MNPEPEPGTMNPEPEPGTRNPEPGTVRITVHPATENDVPLILALIKELADYEGLSGEVVATEAGLAAALFGDSARVRALVAYAGTEPIGFAVYFYNFSTFLGRAGVYLEDLFVRPAWRRHGAGRRLLRELAERAVAEGCGRLEWSVLDWNEPAIRFYRSIGAQPMDEWTVYRLTGEALGRFASDDPPAR